MGGKKKRITISKWLLRMLWFFKAIVLFSNNFILNRTPNNNEGTPPLKEMYAL